MPSNVEIKARVADPDRLRAAVEALADSGPEAIDQEDVFFAVPSGRLKLRITGPGTGELIHYRRADRTGPTLSEYTIAPTSDPGALRAILSAALAVAGVVRKHRRAYRVGQARIHLDRVDGLGDFVELEIVLRADQSEEEGARIALGMMDGLGIAGRDLVDVAYLDLVRGRIGLETSCP